MPFNHKLLQSVKTACLRLIKRADDEAPAAEAPAPAPAPAAPPAPPKPRGPAVAAGGAKPLGAPPVKPDPNWAPEKWKVDRPEAMPNMPPARPHGDNDLREMQLTQWWNNRIALGKATPDSAKAYRALNSATTATERARQAYLANPANPKAAYDYAAAQTSYDALFNKTYKTYVAPDINGLREVRRYNGRVPVSSAGKSVYEKYGPSHELLDEEQLNRIQQLRGRGGYSLPLPQNVP